MARSALAQPPAEAPAPDAAVREMIDRYFLTWSAEDIDRYGQCFMPTAVIQLVDSTGKLTSMPLRAFLNTQRRAHHDATEPMKEVPESVDVRFEGKGIARVVVFWKLTVGKREETGYDHFTLMQSGGEWRIANLLFYESVKYSHTWPTIGSVSEPTQ